MSVEYYQRIVNNLDKEIATLEQKKASYDKKTADQEKKASRVTISKTASSSMIKSKMNQITRYKNEANKASIQSANLMKKIADKRKKRNDAYLRFQKEQEIENKKQTKLLNDMQENYEKQIKDLSEQVILSTKNQISFEQDSNVSLEEPEYDVFISHASEDKEDFVDEFVQELKEREIKVWYDKSQLGWGDSMRKKIDSGLKKSRFGVVILSPSYIAEGKYWTKAELDGLFQLESINGKKILPIWHKLTKKDVINFSPIIGGKFAMNTASFTAKEIVEELKKILDNLKDNDGE